MSYVKMGRSLGCLATAVIVCAGALVCPCVGQLRNAKVGDKMAEFSLVDTAGKTFAFKQGRQRVLAIVFMPHIDKQYEKTAKSVVKVNARLESFGAGYDLVGVVSGTSGKEFAQSLSAEAKSRVRLLIDDSYTLWGELGVIATPTAIVVGKKGTIEWVKAGYGYDFAPALEGRLSQAMGLAKKEAPSKSVAVKTVANSTTSAKVKRHLQMAKLLESKGRLSAAIAEMQKARELDPNSFEVAMELGEFLCRTGESKTALTLAERIQVKSLSEKARVGLLKGWAKRQLGDLKAAEMLLLESAKLDGKSSRVFFELGKIYEVAGDSGKAMASYRRALEIVFGEIAKTGNSQK